MSVWAPTITPVGEENIPHRGISVTWALDAPPICYWWKDFAPSGPQPLRLREMAEGHIILDLSHYPDMEALNSQPSYASVLYPLTRTSSQKTSWFIGHTDFYRCAPWDLQALWDKPSPRAFSGLLPHNHSTCYTWYFIITFIFMSPRF